jgi:hypothetical protein
VKDASSARSLYTVRGRKDDDRDLSQVAISQDLGEHRGTVHPWHHPVEHDDARQWLRRIHEEG